MALIHVATDNNGGVKPVGAGSANAGIPIAGGDGSAIAGPTNPSSVNQTPSTAATSAPTTTQTAVAAGSLVAKAAAGNCYGFNAVSGASAGYLMLFDANAVPVDGTVTPKKVYVMAANSSLGLHWDVPRRFGSGITAVFSTTGPFTKTISATAFISVDYV